MHWKVYIYTGGEEGIEIGGREVGVCLLNWVRCVELIASFGEEGMSVDIRVKRG